jgi:hypothetical protein
MVMPLKSVPRSAGRCTRRSFATRCDAEKRAQLVAKKSKRMHKLKLTASLRKLKPKPSSNWPRRVKRCALRWLTWL